MLFLQYNQSSCAPNQNCVLPDSYTKSEEYIWFINLLNKGYAIRIVAKQSGKGISTVQRVKKEFVV